VFGRTRTGRGSPLLGTVTLGLLGLVARRGHWTRLSLTSAANFREPLLVGITLGFVWAGLSRPGGTRSSPRFLDVMGRPMQNLPSTPWLSADPCAFLNMDPASP